MRVLRCVSWAVVAAGCAVSVSAGASLPVQTGCTAMGGVSGVIVDYRDIEPRPSQGSVRVCFEGTCADAPLAHTSPMKSGATAPPVQDEEPPVQDEAANAMAVLPQFDSPDARTVEVSLRTLQGELVPPRSVRVTPVLVEPNGPSCDPHLYQARVRLSRAAVVEEPVGRH